MILISGPVIAKLALRTRKWAHEHMRRGTFGPLTVDSSGVLFAELSSVESRLGGPITHAQLEPLPVAFPPGTDLLKKGGAPLVDLIEATERKPRNGLLWPALPI